MDNPVLIGENIYFRPIELADIDRGWLKWINDPNISGNLNSVGYPMTKDDLELYYKKSKPPNTVMFAVCNKEDNRYVGNARISQIDWQHRTCTYGRLIGDLNFRGKGIGTEILVLMLRYAFRNLGMNRVYTHIFSDNTASIRSNENVGMKREGLLRQAFYKTGVYKDAIILSMLREEYDRLYPDNE